MKSLDQPLYYLRFLLDEWKVNASNNEDSLQTELDVPSGRYELADYLVDSCTLDLRGNKTRIMYMEGRNEASKPKLKDERKYGITAETSNKMMFIFTNCTVSLWNMVLDSGGTGTSIGRLMSSSVRIVGSTMLSNAEMSPFVIVGGGGGVESSIYVIDSVHESCDTGILLPVAWETSLESEEWRERERDDLGDMGSIWVWGSGMKVSNVHLIVGSGPLFGRCEGITKYWSSGNEKSKVSTRLVGSKIWNTTSSVGCCVEGIGEGILGCSVWNCTNHLSGTAIGGMNHGGSLLSHNTSFTGSHTPSSPNEDIDLHVNQHFTTRTSFQNKTTPDRQYTRCTFKRCSTVYSGGAMDLYNVPNNLTIDQCSFHACSATRDGGALYLYYFIYDDLRDFSLSASSFVGCSAGKSGGSIWIHRTPVLSISGCVFLDSKSVETAGAISSWICDFEGSSSFSNTLFQNCRQTGTHASYFKGGALTFFNCDTQKLSFIQFRHCFSANGFGHDINIEDTPFDSSSFSTCDSTSPNIRRVTSYQKDHSSFLANSQSEVRVESLTSTLAGNGVATLTLTLNKAVSGSMIVVVSNLDGTRQEVVGKAPKIGRVLVFPFTSSAVGKCSSFVGESELLQSPPSDYIVLAASISKISVLVRSLIDASCVLDASRTEVELMFSGIDIPEGLCTLSLNDTITLEVTFRNENGRSVGTVTKGASGKAGELSEKTTYALTGIKSKVNSSASIRIASGIDFTVPETARLSDVSVSDFLDQKQTKVKLSFTSIQLEANKKYVLKLQRTDTSEDAITRQLETDADGSLVDVEEILFPFETSGEGRKEQLKYGLSFGVLSLTASGRTRSVLISDIVITMPDEPSRLVKIEKEDDEGLNSTTLTLSSRVLTVGEEYEMKVTGTPLSSSSSSNANHETTIKVTVSSVTSNTVTLTLYPLDEAIVK
ncbi:hypothetical protein BLNAU_5192 [Blattamonas nauphoetae]|uniref:Uncharacterized protein n=1 Tax=Blattamonas nauphoetae TaxID=2049346 RepID=A0ABQ9Y7J8_9EUKA|nr:hypothetical protein BLNAU_5192 [Blattamonas nauphoetae]